MDDCLATQITPYCLFELTARVSMETRAFPAFVHGIMLELWQDIANMIVSFSERSLIPDRTSLFQHENLGLNHWPNRNYEDGLSY